MKVEGFMFSFISVFLSVSTVVYWYLSGDPASTTALALGTRMSFLIGFYLLFTARRLAGPRPEDLPDADIEDNAGVFGFYSPRSWFPLLAAGGAAMIMVGIAFLAWWLFIVGFAVILLGVSGFLFEYTGDRHPAGH